MELTEQQKTAIAYGYFTLKEWQLLAKCVSHTHGDLFGTKMELNKDVVRNLLSKFPPRVV